jgi:flotillin
MLAILPIPIIIIAIVVIVLLVGLINQYRRVAPNEIMVISGGGIAPDPATGSKTKIVSGGGTFVIPILQEYTYISQKPFTVQSSVKNVPTTNQVPINVGTLATIRIGQSDAMRKTAAQRILGTQPEQLIHDLSDILGNQVRAIIAQLTPEEANTDRLKFQENVINLVEPLLAEFGLELVTLSIESVSDENQYFDNLASIEIANNESRSRINLAQADKEARIKEADAQQLANRAEKEAQQKNAEVEKETAIKQAEYTREQQVAVIEAQRQQQIANIEAQRQQELAKAEADKVVAEKNVETAKVEQAQKVVEAETVAKTQLIAQNQEADAKAYAIKADAEAQADKVRKNGEAEAESIRQIGLAKAESQEKLAKTFETQGAQMIIMQELVKVLPDIAAKLAEPLSNIDNMTVYDGVKGITGAGVGQMPVMFDFIKQSTGMDLSEMAQKRAEGTLTVQEVGKAKEIAEVISETTEDK